MNVILPQNTHQDLFVTSHDQQHLIFSIDNFGSKIVGKHNADHLINTFKKHYNVTIDLNGGILFRIKLKWDYDKKLSISPCQITATGLFQPYTILRLKISTFPSFL